MADDDRFARPLHPDDMARLEAALLRGRALEVVPDRPPAYATGKDAEVLSKVADLKIEQAVGKFLTGDQIDAKIEKALTEKLNRIGLRTDEEHIEQTGDDVRRTIRWQRYLDNTLRTIVITGLGALVVKALSLIGVNVPLPGQGGH